MKAPRRRNWTFGRVAGWLILLGAVALIATVAVSVLDGFDPAELWTYAPLLLKGAGLTLFITGFAFVVGTVLALPVAWAHLSGIRAIRLLASLHLVAFRFTPALGQLYLVYFGAGEFSRQLDAIGIWWLFSEPINCVLLVFTLNASAYQGYILSGSIRSVDKGQVDGARALGLTPWIAFRKVLLPQALRVALRPMGNEFTKLMKASSIASVITIYDLLGATKLIYSETFNLDYYILTAAIYILLVEMSARIVDVIEKAMSPMDRRAAKAGQGTA